jgi:hypothetical protein
MARVGECSPLDAATRWLHKAVHCPRVSMMLTDTSHLAAAHTYDRVSMSDLCMLEWIA